MAEESGARDAAREMLDGRVDAKYLDALFDQVLTLEKKARGWCPECQKQVWVDIPDAKAVVSALSELITKVAALPTNEVDVDQIVFEHVVYMAPPSAADKAPV